jgi:hypothetical protein
MNDEKYHLTEFSMELADKRDAAIKFIIPDGLHQGPVLVKMKFKDKKGDAVFPRYSHLKETIRFRTRSGTRLIWKGNGEMAKRRPCYTDIKGDKVGFAHHYGDHGELKAYDIVDDNVVMCFFIYSANENPVIDYFVAEYGKDHTTTPVPICLSYPPTW